MALLAGLSMPYKGVMRAVLRFTYQFTQYT